MVEGKSKKQCVARYQFLRNAAKKSDPKTILTSSTPSEWTLQQQKALEKALVLFKADMDKNERWTAIAGIISTIILNFSFNIVFCKCYYCILY